MIWNGLSGAVVRVAGVQFAGLCSYKYDFRYKHTGYREINTKSRWSLTKVTVLYIFYQCALGYLILSLLLNSEYLGVENLWIHGLSLGNTTTPGPVLGSLLWSYTSLEAGVNNNTTVTLVVDTWVQFTTKTVYLLQTLR